MSALLELVRPDLRGFVGYRSARSENLRGEVWLNANEAAWRSDADVSNLCRRYPEPQPVALCQALAALYGCEIDQLLVGRGSDEAIDLLMRALCVPGRDAVVVTPPVFAMYAVSARLQGAPLLEVPLCDTDTGFVPDFDKIADAALAHGAKIVFLCSPCNPCGAAIAAEDIMTLATRLQGRALVVVDEAYVEFSRFPSVVPQVAQQENLAVLRTLSKAHALAAARIGCVIAHPDMVAVLRACQAPYPVPAPSTQLALAALTPAMLSATQRRVEEIITERERMRGALAAMPAVVHVYPSEGNFLLARFRDAGQAFKGLLSAGVVVRDQRMAPQLADALRITIGTPRDNDRVLAALRLQKAAA